VVCQLLSSKLASDVTEAINFFVSAFEFGLLNAMVGVRKMLALIFSREPSIQVRFRPTLLRIFAEILGSTLNPI